MKLLLLALILGACVALLPACSTVRAVSESTTNGPSRVEITVTTPWSMKSALSNLRASAGKTLSAGAKDVETSTQIQDVTGLITAISKATAPVPK